MTFMYDAVHNTVRRVEVDDDALDERGLLKDGKRVRVPMMMRDSNNIPRWASDEAARALGRDAATDDAWRARQAAYMTYQLDVSNRWRGGVGDLQPGDVVAVGDRQGVVASHDDGKLVITDASKLDAETLKQHAYDSYDRDIQNSWMNTRDAEAGGACTTAGRQSEHGARRTVDWFAFLTSRVSLTNGRWLVRFPTLVRCRTQSASRTRHTQLTTRIWLSAGGGST